MAGIGGPGSSDPQNNPSTPLRRTYVRFDVAQNSLLEAAIYKSKKAEDIALGPQSKWKDTRMVSGIGIQLLPYQTDIGKAQEFGTKYNQQLLSTVDGGTMFVAPAVSGKYGWRTPTDQPGSLVGADGDLATQGFRVYSKDISASIDWNDPTTVLADDQNQFPSPATDEDGIVMDRIAVDSQAHNGSGLFFSFNCPGPSAKASSAFVTRYFSGPASENAQFYGFGNYAIKFRGDGYAVQYELGLVKTSGVILTSTQPTWQQEFKFRFAQPNYVFGITHWVEIRPHLYGQPQNGRSGSITYTCGNTAAAPGNFEGSVFSAISHSATGGDTTIAKYYIPMFGTTPPPTQQAPIRGDDRRDLVPEWSINNALFPTTGYVFDDPWSPDGLIGCSLVENAYLYLSIKADLPDGCSISIDLFPQGANPDTDTPIPTAGTGSIAGVGVWNAYDPTNTDLQNALVNRNGVQAKITLNGTGADTPTVYWDVYSKDAVNQYVAPGEWTGGQLRSVSVLGATKDPSEQSGVMTIDDETDSLPLLRTRTIIPVQIETEYDATPAIDWTNPANDYLRSVLHRGQVVQEPGTQMGSDEPDLDINGNPYVDPRRGYPSPDWTRYEIQFVGEYRRVSKAISPGLKDYSASLENRANNPTGLPYKATDAIRELIGWAGYGAEQIDIPDLPIRLWPNLAEGVRLTPGANLIQLAVDIARDYLNYWLVFDPNAKTPEQTSLGTAFYFGVWRLVGPPAGPPWNNLAYFATNPDAQPSAPVGAWNTGHSLRDYPARMGLDNQPIVGAPIFKKYRRWRHNPEFNKLTVLGLNGPTMGNSDKPTSVASSICKQTCYNPRSFSFYPAIPTADPTSPDYIPEQEEYRRIDPTLPTAFSVQFTAGRLMSYAGIAREYWGIISPLPLVQDITDSLAYKPRPMRYGDPILIDEIQCFTTGCGIFYTKDGHQMAHIEAQEELIPLPGLPVGF